MDACHQNRIPTPQSLTKQHDRALLLVTFGSTLPGPHATFERLKASFAEHFPDRDIFLAFTSKFCIRKWAERSGEQYYTTDKWLEAIGAAGYRQVSIQSLHVIPGLEYSFIEDRYIPQFRRNYPEIPTTVGVPLLWSSHDIARVGDCLYSLFEERLDRGEAVVLMGHGNHTDKYPEANGRYDRLAEYLQTRSPRFFVGTVDYGSLLFEHVAEQLAATCPPGCVINFLPLMSVAGDHAQNDMLGDYDPEEPLEKQSWRVRFSQLGYTIEDSNCHLKGLGDFASIRQIWIDHLVEAERQQHQH